MSLATTVTFSEKDNSFESFLSYTPEMMCDLGDLLITFKDGQLYTHDSSAFNRFFGIDYPSYITVVFNQNPVEGKRFLSLDERSNVIWTCPEIETSLMSFSDTPQQSSILAGDFELVEGKWCAKFNQDANSIGGLINGDSLTGFWIKIKFQVDSAETFVNLSQILLNFIDSPKNV